MSSNMMFWEMLLLVVTFLIVAWIIFIVSQNSTKEGFSPVWLKDPSCATCLKSVPESQSSPSSPSPQLCSSYSVPSISSLPIHPQSILINMPPPTAPNIAFGKAGDFLVTKSRCMRYSYMLILFLFFFPPMIFFLCSSDFSSNLVSLIVTECWVIVRKTSPALRLYRNWPPVFLFFHLHRFIFFSIQVPDPLGIYPVEWYEVLIWLYLFL